MNDSSSNDVSPHNCSCDNLPDRIIGELYDKFYPQRNAWINATLKERGFITSRKKLNVFPNGFFSITYGKRTILKWVETVETIQENDKWIMRMTATELHT